MKAVELFTLLLSAASAVGLRIYFPLGRNACSSPLLFECDNGACTRAEYICDGDKDCSDGSDEGRCSTRTCPDNAFRCKDTGRCIPQSWKCDHENDCGDGSDEADVECGGAGGCPGGHFACGPTSCIPQSWVCDGDDDCLSRKDEENCDHDCDGGGFKCDSGTCIESSWVCDGSKDCRDGSDERNCTACSPGNFRCASGSCIPQRWVCDGDYDCPDNSDEKDCAHSMTTGKPICHPTEFQCPDQITCIDKSWVCNGKEECLDGADESPKICKNVTCSLDEFKCNNNKCIAGHMQCNGVDNCSDNSDEANCEEPKPPCLDDEFDCGERYCIQMNLVCNGKPDCPKGEDEPTSCGKNECASDNGGCAHKCVDTPTGFRCECRSGYEPFELFGRTACRDINECDNASSCSQICINEKGTFKCECMDGYVKDNTDHTRCKSDTDFNTSLIVTKRHDIREVSLRKSLVKAIVNQTKAAIALDIYVRLGLIFWSDALDKKIYKVNISDGSNPIPIIKSDLTLCDGLAVDWIYDHIYWTDAERDSISVAGLDGKMIKMLITDHLDKPRAIAVNPLDGWMYWSDWGTRARIERAGMDGSHRTTIVSHDVEWPNGITLDLVKGRLFWIDARLDMVSSVNYDGSRRATVIRRSDSLLHPFSLAVFEDHIYWTDWVNNAIFRADKYTGGNVTKVAESLSSVMVVHVNHPYKQPKGTKYCSSMKCSHLCLPAPQINDLSSKTKCACPDGLILTKNGHSCSKTGDEITHSPEQTLGHTSTVRRPGISVTTTPATPTTRQGDKPTPTKPSNVSVDGSHVSSPHPDSNSLNVKEALGREEESSNAHTYIVVVAVSVLVVVVAIALYYSHRYYYKTPRESISFTNPIYSKVDEEGVTLTKDDYNRFQDGSHESEEQASRSNGRSYENFL